MINKFVLVRTNNAGVHCGYLTEIGNGVVILREPRRVWRWRGANTLYELSMHGADLEWTRISEPAIQVILLDAIEVIEVHKDAIDNLTNSRWGSDN